MAIIENITDDQREKIEEHLAEVAAEVKALLREVDEDAHIDQAGWIDCIERVEEHLTTLKRRVLGLR